MKSVDQKFLRDLEPGEIVIFDGRKWYYVGIIDGKPRLCPVEPFRLTIQQDLNICKRLKKHPEGMTYAEFKSILNNDVQPDEQPDTNEEHLGYSELITSLYYDYVDKRLKKMIEESGESSEQGVFLQSSEELKAPVQVEGESKWWVRSPRLPLRNMESPLWYSQAAEKFEANIVDLMNPGRFYLQQLFSTAFLEFDSLQKAKDCKTWAENHPEMCGHGLIALIDTTDEESFKCWKDYLKGE